MTAQICLYSHSGPYEYRICDEKNRVAVIKLNDLKTRHHSDWPKSPT